MSSCQCHCGSYDMGLSSETMRARLVHGLPGRGDHPHDPGDFGRCERFLRRNPHLRERLPFMADVSSEWAALVARWDDIAALMEEEVPGCLDTPSRWGSAPRAYALMRELINSARQVTA